MIRPPPVVSIIVLLSVASPVDGFQTPQSVIGNSRQTPSFQLGVAPPPVGEGDVVPHKEHGLFPMDAESVSSQPVLSRSTPVALAATAATAFLPILPAAASSTELISAADPLPSALAAYGHYFCILLSLSCVVTERATIKVDMTDDEQQRLGIADLIYGLAALGIFISGYLRVTQYGKGWEFYSHEPLFWLKLSLFGVAASLSYFPTIIILKRGFSFRETGEWPPISQELVDRLATLMNAQILALLSIPLAATTMARGIWYNQDFPWFAGAAVFLLCTVGFGYKYVKEGLSWEEEPKEPTSSVE